jgi:ribosomal protein S18 acetylase RimI-like enzyme
MDSRIFQKRLEAEYNNDMNITFRTYLPKDRENLLVLLDELVISEAQYNELRLSAPKEQYATLFLEEAVGFAEQGTGIITIAEDDNRIIGYGIGYLKLRTPEDEHEYKDIRVGYIDDLFILDEYRNMGVGTNMMKMIEEFFQEIQCQYSELSVCAKNTLAHSLYLREGYQDHLIHMLKRLE